MAGAMKPLAPAVGQRDPNILGLHRRGRQSTKERSLLRGNVPSLTVLKLVTPAPLQQGNPSEIPMIAEHFQGRLVSEDKSPLLVNDDKRDSYMVQNGLKKRGR